MLKFAIILLVIIAVSGYAWYADLLPPDLKDTIKEMVLTLIEKIQQISNTVTKELVSPLTGKIQQISNTVTKELVSPLTGKIQQISNVVSSEDHQIIYYSVETVPNVPDGQIPIDALKKATDAWVISNPNLEFIRSESTNIEIKWEKYAPLSHTGLAICNTVLFGILSHCVLEISVGAKDCSSNFVQNDENMVANILMHEIGHALGLEHTDDENNLMYSDESVQVPFDTRGYTIPEKFEELYVGQKLLLSDQKELEAQIDSLDSKISHEQPLYDEYQKQYERYEGRTLSVIDYEEAQKIFLKLDSLGKKINSMIAQQNELIVQINDIVNELACYPNFDLNLS